MTFGELWALMILKQSKLLDDEATVEIKVKQFKRALGQAYDAGARHQVNKEVPPMPDFMKGIFG